MNCPSNPNPFIEHFCEVANEYAGANVLEGCDLSSKHHVNIINVAATHARQAMEKKQAQNEERLAATTREQHPHHIEESPTVAGAPVGHVPTWAAQPSMHSAEKRRGRRYLTGGH